MTSPVQEAAEAALRGELIVMPTDTVYGIGTRPDDAEATSRLFAAKHRPRDLEVPVLVPSMAAAREIARFDELAATLATAFWPGALTLVLARTERSARWELGGDPSTIGVRRPRDDLAGAVLAFCGPLAVTSANRSGRPTPSVCEDLFDAFGDAVAVYLCRDEPLIGVASTVLDLAHGAPLVVREGAVAADALAPFLVV